MDKVWLSQYGQGVPSEVDVDQYQSINQIMDETIKKFPDSPSFYNMGKTLNYRELDKLIENFAAYVQNELGMKKGDRLAIMMPNILQYPVCLFGALRAGLTVVNVNPLYTARELKHQLIDSGATAIVIFANSAHVLSEVINDVPVKHVMLTDIGDLLSFPKSLLVNFVIRHVKKMVPEYHLPKAKSLKKILFEYDGPSLKRPKVEQEDLAFLQYTGGTTGVSKGAILSHKNIIANAIQARAWFEGKIEYGKEIIVTPLPLYHIFSLTANCIIFASMGALNVLITNPRDIPAFVKDLKKFPFTVITGVNTLFNALNNNEEFKSIDFRPMKVALGGGMAVQKAVAEEWKSITGKPLIEAYGLTETSPAVCMNPLSQKDFNGHVGLPLPSTIVAIKSDDGKDLPLGEVGEVCVKGPQVMKGYWKRPEATANVMTQDEYFRTGDMGFMAPDGMVKLVDRKKDMIIVSGFNVFPNEIEDVTCCHPKVLESAAIGIPHDKSGEQVKLFVVKKDTTLTQDELITYLKKNLTAYKVPKIVEFRGDLPKSNVGKILRKDLRPQT